MPRPSRIFISSGELSGDFHGSHLVKAIKKLSPDSRFYGVGSHNMERAGVELLYESSNWGGIGIYQNLKKLPMVNRIGRKLLKEIPKMYLDLIIVIDYRVFHTRLLKGLRNLKVGKLYYFAPVVWPGSIQKPLGKAYSNLLRNFRKNSLIGDEAKNRFEILSELADKLIVAYPFALDDYRKVDADVEFLGHPLMNVINADRKNEDVRHELGIDNKTKLIGIFPGSRQHEIDCHMPILSKVMDRLNKEFGNVLFYIPVAHANYNNLIGKFLINKKYPVILTEGDNYDIFAASDIALSKTGTSVQELMALGVPTVAFYTVVSSLWYNLTLKYILEFEHVAFPNIIAGERVIPEFIQDDFTVENIAKASIEILSNDDSRKKMKEELLAIRESLYKPDALERAAEIAMELIK